MIYYRGIKSSHTAVVLLVLESDGACTSLNGHSARKTKFPWRAVVLLVLESDSACTGLNGHSARKSAVLVLVCCCKARADREQEL